MRVADRPPRREERRHTHKRTCRRRGKSAIRSVKDGSSQPRTGCLRATFRCKVNRPCSSFDTIRRERRPERREQPLRRPLQGLSARASREDSATGGERPAHFSPDGYGGALCALRIEDCPCAFVHGRASAYGRSGSSPEPSAGVLMFLGGRSNGPTMARGRSSSKAFGSPCTGSRAPLSRI